MKMRSWMLQKTYQWMLGLANHPRAVLWLAIIAFAESSFFPLPPDLLLIPMVLAARNQAWRLALICTIASVLGGLFGYFLGFYFYESFGQRIIDFYHLQKLGFSFQDKIILLNVGILVVVFSRCLNFSKYMLYINTKLN